MYISSFTFGTWILIISNLNVVEPRRTRNHLLVLWCNTATSTTTIDSNTVSIYGLCLRAFFISTGIRKTGFHCTSCWTTWNGSQWEACTGIWVSFDTSFSWKNAWFILFHVLFTFSYFEKLCDILHRNTIWEIC